MLSHDRELLGGYALGVLDDQESRQVEEHPGECDACRDELDELLRLRPMLDLLPAEAFAESPPRPIRSWRGRTWATVGAGPAAAAVVVVAVAMAAGMLIGQGLALGPVVAQPSMVAPAPRALGSPRTPARAVPGSPCGSSRRAAGSGPASGAGWLW